MKNFDDESDEFAKRLLAPLRDTPPLDPLIAAEEKHKYMLQGENYRRSMQLEPKAREGGFLHRITNLFQVPRPLPAMRLLVGVCIALVIFAGSGATVYAAQSSLPGEPLYFIKSITEDIRLTFTSSPQARLDLTLDYTDRRMDEISTLVTKGKDVPSKASERFDDELENALLLASQMDDAEMQKALGQIIKNAQSQGISIEELITKLPDNAGPAIIRLQQRLQEQVQLSEIGKDNPSNYRTIIRERQRHHPANHTTQPGNRPATPTPKVHGNPDKDKDKDNNGKGQPSDVPSHEGAPPGQEKSTPDK